MGFDQIDRRYGFARSNGLVVLECVHCGSDRQVAMCWPLWEPDPGHAAVEEPLCPACAALTIRKGAATS